MKGVLAAALGKDPTEDEVKTLKAEFDLDGDKLVSFDEWMKTICGPDCREDSE